MTTRRRAVTSLLAVALASCSGSTTVDAGADLGARDLGTVDLGASDLGPRDAGVGDGACTTDADGDGHSSVACGGDDCDDADANRYPGHAEVCDASRHDEDCDPLTFGSTDADSDGYVDIACCNTAGTTMHCGDDCDDANANVHPTQAEVCNGIDDDCDGMADDIIHGTVVCRQGDSHTCTTACGGSGTASCSATCLGFDPCVGPEVCNGCDDDNDGATDDGFTCARASLGTCTVPTCGSTGTRTCDTACDWGSCWAAAEVCNYCDDTGDGNFDEEKPFATASASDHFSDCSGGTQPMFGTATDCSTTPTSDGFALWATLLDGTAVPQAGALWLEPTGWVQGWGPMDVDVELEVTAVTAGGSFEMPLGGWTVVVAHGGTPGVGPANANGLPASIVGIGARWFWSTFDSTSSAPPSAGDSTRAFGLGPLRADGSAPDWGLFSGDSLFGGSTTLDGPGTGTINERMHITYTPDDPTTVGNEETLVLTSTAGVTSTRTYHPSGAQPIGTGPLVIGITAGTYTQSGFSGPPAGSTFGVPVRARVHVFSQHMHSGGLPPTFDFPVAITRAGLCP